MLVSEMKKKHIFRSLHDVTSTVAVALVRGLMFSDFFLFFEVVMQSLSGKYLFLRWN